MLAEAALVTLDRLQAPPAQFAFERDGVASSRRLAWSSPSRTVLRAHANELDATEQGAYSVSIAALELEAGLVAVKRAETLTGADYYVAALGSDPDDLEEAFRLEVSGVGTGNEAVCRSRLEQKMRQTARGRSNLPAVAAVVGFGAGLVLISPVMGDAR